MQIYPVPVVETVEPIQFQTDYLQTHTPVVIKDMARNWPAFQKWDWDYLKATVGNQPVGIYNNTKSNATTPVNQPDGYKLLGEYIDMISHGPAEWRIFLFNIFRHAPHLVTDITWPEHLMKGFVKKYPMLFLGGEGAITHMHFDMDLSHIFHTQFWGQKRVLLFPNDQQHKLYRKPFEVMTLVDFSNYNSRPVLLEEFPALKLAKGYEIILERGDTLFMPSGYWHHMEYLKSGFAMSLRALPSSAMELTRTIWNLIGMRNIDTLMKRTSPIFWDNLKVERTMQQASKEIQKSLVEKVLM